MNEAMRHGHGHDDHHDTRDPGGLGATGVGAGLRTSTLRQSALQRLVIAALPILGLWLAVAFALDLFA